MQKGMEKIYLLRAEERYLHIVQRLRAVLVFDHRFEGRVQGEVWREVLPSAVRTPNPCVLDCFVLNLSLSLSCIRITHLKVVVVRQVVGQLYVEEDAGLVGPAARHVTNRVPAAAHDQRGQIEGLYEAHTLSVALRTAIRKVRETEKESKRKRERERATCER